MRLAYRLLPALLSVSFAVVSRAQAPAVTFTAEDALNVNNYAIADLTADGRYLVLTNTVRRDSYGQDFRRDGDPTYTRGVPLRVLVVDTKTGASQSVFPDKKAVRALRWSPDGKRLAMLIYNGDVFEPAIWDRATNKVVTSHLPAGKYVAENSDLRWAADGKQLVFAVHTMEWRKKARDTFTNMTTGPVFVQSSLDPFLAWDDVRRLGNVRSVASFDPATGQLRELVPETMVSTYTLAEDGSAISYNQDIQKKTDYDSFGSETSLRTRPGAGGAERVVFASTKGLQLQWSDDGKHYAYAKDGRIYTGSIDDKDAKLLIGPPELKVGERPDTSKAAATPRQASAIRWCGTAPRATRCSSRIAKACGSSIWRPPRASRLLRPMTRVSPAPATHWAAGATTGRPSISRASRA